MIKRKLLKWAGSKSWILETHGHLFPAPETITGYREPFLGGGAIAGHYLGRTQCHLSDLNEHLMTMYRAVRDDPDDVIRLLRGLKYDRERYLVTRSQFNYAPKVMPAERAAWMIYLNRTGFNGLYRENRKGEFNVPFGRYTNPTICDEPLIRAWSEALQGSTLAHCDYMKTLAGAREGEFIFLDPPYVPASKTASFTAYQAGGFGRVDQERLIGELYLLDIRGIKWMLTNSAEARGLYESRWHVLDVQVARRINSKGSKRGKVGEIIVANFPLQAVAEAA